MDLKKIKDIYRFIKDTDIVEFELEGSDGKVRIKRGCQSTGAVQSPVPSPPLPVMSLDKEKEPENKIPLKEERHKTITSPMVGTFYRSPSPDAQSFVEVDSNVKKGQVLCIIEAMKLMNEIESEYDGRIISILVENGHPVEYGEPLFIIETV
ncbi:MAG: acetyl-CoA carboxylase biotin carboxyl carrier protein [Deltaproteobacteria bacterium]|nr:acetyl-CoA carboxylase biotin carboxyl carrier protein [Deltaproteobacteria bacterium]